jgi:FkbM family methyltransferase
MTLLHRTKQFYWASRNPRPLLRRAIYHVYRPHLVTRSGITYRLHDRRDWASESIYVYGSHARWVTAVMTAALPSVQSIIDVGANIGCVTLPIAKAFAGPVLSLEPARSSFTLLQDNLRLNGLTNVDARCLAVSDRSGSARLSHSPTNSGDHRLAVGPNEHRTESELVNVVTLDSLITSRLPPPHLLKIDVQGHELHVLRGASHLLSQPCLVIAECWPYGLRIAGSSMADLIDLIRAVGLTAYVISEHRLSLEPASLDTLTTRLSPDREDDSCDLVLTNRPLRAIGLHHLLL